MEAQGCLAAGAPLFQGGFLGSQLWVWGHGTDHLGSSVCRACVWGCRGDVLDLVCTMCPARGPRHSVPVLWERPPGGSSLTDDTSVSPAGSPESEDTALLAAECGRSTSVPTSRRLGRLKGRAGGSRWGVGFHLVDVVGGLASPVGLPRVGNGRRRWWDPPGEGYFLA